VSSSSIALLSQLLRLEVLKGGTLAQLQRWPGKHFRTDDQ
jgi:hypothetical protein